MVENDERDNAQEVEESEKVPDSESPPNKIDRIREFISAWHPITSTLLTLGTIFLSCVAVYIANTSVDAARDSSRAYITIERLYGENMPYCYTKLSNWVNANMSISNIGNSPAYDVCVEERLFLSKSGNASIIESGKTSHIQTPFGAGAEFCPRQGIHLISDSLEGYKATSKDSVEFFIYYEATIRFTDIYKIRRKTTMMFVWDPSGNYTYQFGGSRFEYWQPVPEHTEY